MTNNTTPQDVIDLFPDNTNNDISANNIRTAFSGVFTDRQENLVKILDFSELPILTNIYEGSLVVVYSGENIGLWLSTINQPQIEDDLIKIAGI